jgi:RNA polymerase sigma-70 factor (ECF subfamily)
MDDVPSSIDPPKHDAAPPLSPDETIVLLRRVRSGDDEALNALLARILPRLRRWAHGRLPQSARGMLDTGDIVQTVVVKAVRQLSRLDVQQQGSLGWYLRQAIRNEIASEWRKAARAPLDTTLSESIPVAGTSPFDLLVRAERLEQYDAALDRLEPADRDAIVGRFELGYDYEELARYLGKGSAATARVAVHRAVKRLLHEAQAPGPVPPEPPAPVGP